MGLTEEPQRFLSIHETIMHASSIVLAKFKYDSGTLFVKVGISRGPAHFDFNGLYTNVELRGRLEGRGH